MAAAYAYADGGHISREALLISYIERFGVQAVMGRAHLGAGEMMRMITAENIVMAYQARADSENWAEWAAKNKKASRLLNAAAKLADVDTDQPEVDNLPEVDNGG